MYFHQDDLDLALGALAGERLARQRFAERMRCVPRILAARNVRLGRPLAADDVADLAQEAVLRLWRKLDSYEGRASLESWAYGFCSLEIMNEIRRASRRPDPLPDPEECGGAAEPEAVPIDMDAGLRREEGEGWLTRLAERERQVVHLRHFEGLEVKEIALSLDITLSSVKTHYYRAIEKLRQWLPNPDLPPSASA